ncbi:MAG: DUF5995 family protein, partial [Actinomycetota bacterium]|nr:DUF5995 family protein [Actinomycetota bacterium]
MTGSDIEKTRDRPRRWLDTTLGELDAIIDETRRGHSQLGVFPSMYRSVTAEIRDAVRSDFFDDGKAMEDLAVTFADRYLDAYRRWSNADTTTDSWKIAFEAATDGRRRMIAQHLLAGMNAHINLDLGIVAADIAGNEPERLHTDFLRVNQILFQKLNGLQEALGSVSTRMAWIDRLGGTLDERLMKLSIKDARDRAWDLALDLIENPEDSNAIIETRDQETADLSHTILGGVLPVRALSWFVAGSEPADVTAVLDAFAEKPIDLDAVEAAVSAEAGIRRG